METFSVLDSHSKMIPNSLIFMVFSWGNVKSSDNGQDIELDLAFNNVKPKDWYFVLDLV